MKNTLVAGLVAVSCASLMGLPAHAGSKCFAKGMITSSVNDVLPKGAKLKVSLIEAGIMDVAADTIATRKRNVSGKKFPLRFFMKVNCERLANVIDPQFSVRIEQGKKLLYINDTSHGFSPSKRHQKIEVIKVQ